MKTISLNHVVYSAIARSVTAGALAAGNGAGSADTGTQTFGTRGECVAVRQSFENKTGKECGSRIRRRRTGSLVIRCCRTPFLRASDAVHRGRRGLVVHGVTPTMTF